MRPATRRPRVLAAIVIAPHLKGAGAITAATELSVELARFCDIDIAIMAESESEEQIGGVRVLRRSCSNILSFTEGFLPQRYRSLLFRSDLPDLAASGEYDLVHIHNVMPTLEMHRIARACYQNDIPYLVSGHGFIEISGGVDSYSLRRVHERMAWKLLVESPFSKVLTNANLVLALSPAEIPFISAIGVPEERIRVVSNGISSSFIEGIADAPIERVSSELQIEPKQGVPVAFFLANHTPNKGLQVLLDALESVASPFQLVVGGEKRDYVDYQRYEGKRGSDQQVVFTGRVDQGLVSALFRIADLFVFPSLADTYPLVILEAMASGCAIVASNVGGIPYQTNDECAVLISPGDAASLGDVLEGLLRSTARIAKMGEAAALAATAHMGWERPAEQAFGAYEHVLGI